MKKWKKLSLCLKNQTEVIKCNEDTSMQTRHNLISYQCTSLFWWFPVLISDNLASILQPYSLVYSKSCQTSKVESFVRIAMKKIMLLLKIYSFLIISVDKGSVEINKFAQNHFILEVPPNWLVHTFLSKCEEILILAPICLNVKFSG